MSESITPVQLEYRKRRSKILKSVVLCILVPFALTAIGSYLDVPQSILSFGMAITMIGLAVFIVYLWRVWKCPNCGRSLCSSWGGGTLGGKCIACQVQLYPPKFSKDGRMYQ